jgi:chromosome segregation ATPase
MMKLLQVCQSLYPQLSLESFTKEVRSQWHADLCWMRRLSISSQLSLIDKSSLELLLWIKLSAPTDQEGFDYVRKQLFIHQKQSAKLIQLQQSSYNAEEKRKLAQIELHSRINGLEETLQLKDELINEMRHQFAFKDTELLDQANMISQLQMRIAAETIKSQEAHKQNSMLQECIEKLTVELEDNNAKMDDIETQSRDQIGDFLLKLESQSMEIQDLKGMKATLEESNTILEADLLMTKDQIEDLQTHLQQANEQAAAMQESLEHSHRNEASMLRSQLSELTARLHSGQQLIASLKDELATLRLGEGQLRLQIGSLKDQLEERDRQSKEDREEIARLSKALYT